MTDSSPAKGLPPCPFCGTEAHVVMRMLELPNGTRDTLYSVECMLRECGVTTREWYPESAAIASWNRRAQEEPGSEPPPEPEHDAACQSRGLYSKVRWPSLCSCGAVPRGEPSPEIRAALLSAQDELESLYVHHPDLRPLKNFVLRKVESALAAVDRLPAGPPDEPVKTLAAAEKLCRIYFEIAASAIGEDEVRRLRDEALNALPQQETEGP